MIKTSKGKEYGKRMKVISTMYLNKMTKIFKSSDSSYEDDLKMIYDDACNLQMIGAYMIEGHFYAAMGVASSLDTAVRDEIPASIWNYLEKFTIDQE